MVYEVFGCAPSATPNYALHEMCEVPDTAVIAQLVEPRIVIPVVVGSSPIDRPSF